MKEGLLHLADGRELGYAEYGAPDGQPVLYCHGFPTSRLELVPSESIIQALDAPPRVIAIDRPGFGLSTFQARRTFLGWPQDVAEAADLLGIGRFAMVGASGGCPYALACGAALGDRVLRLGIVVGAGPIQAPGMASSPIAGVPASHLARRIQFGLLALALKAGWEDRVVAQAIATLGELDQRAMEQADVRDWFYPIVARVARPGRSRRGLRSRVIPATVGVRRRGRSYRHTAVVRRSRQERSGFCRPMAR